MQVFTFWLTFPDQPGQGELVFARGQEREGFTAARDAHQQAQEYAQQNGRDAKFTSTDFGTVVDEDKGKAAAGARMIGRTPGGAHSVKVLGVMHGLGSPLMSDFFGGRDVGGGAASDTGQGMFSGASFNPNLLNPPGGGAGGGAAGMRTPIVQSEELEFGPAFRAGLRDRDIRLGPGGGVAGRLAETFRRPIESRAFANIAFNEPTATGTAEEATLPSFQEYVRTGDLFGAGAAQDARRLLEQARGFGNQFETAGSLAGGILNPATTGQAQTLANIARQAARQRYGAFARFLPSAADFGEQYLAQPSGGALTFGDFLNQKIFGT